MKRILLFLCLFVGVTTALAQRKSGSSGVLVLQDGTTKTVSDLDTAQTVTGVKTHSGNATNLIVGDVGDAGAQGVQFNASQTGTGFINFGDNGNEDVGSISYSHTNDEMTLRVEDQDYFNVGKRLVRARVTGGADIFYVNHFISADVTSATTWMTVNTPSSGDVTISLCDGSNGGDHMLSSVAWSCDGDNCQFDIVQRMNTAGGAGVTCGGTTCDIQLGSTANNKLCVWGYAALFFPTFLQF